MEKRDLPEATAETTIDNPIKQVYRRLSQAGVSRNYIKERVLPSWWDDEAARTPAGFSEGLLLLSRHLGISLSQLRNEDAAISLASGAHYRLKTPKNSPAAEIGVARSIAIQVARHVALGVGDAHPPLPSSATEIRQRVLSEHPRWVDLSGLVAFCWKVGVPVVFISSFPPNTKRMHGMAVRVGGTPVIVVSVDKKQPAWLLFIVAHELGHLALDHVKNDEILVDEEVTEDSVDAEEQEANAFAIELLTGAPKKRFTTDVPLKAARLARQAATVGEEHQIDPGHIVLNYANSMARSHPSVWATANTALAMLQPGADAPALLRSRLRQNLDWSCLPEAAREFVARVCDVPALDE